MIENLEDFFKKIFCTEILVLLPNLDFLFFQIFTLLKRDFILQIVVHAKFAEKFVYISNEYIVLRCDEAQHVNLKSVNN